MALTIANAHPQFPALSVGNVRGRAVKVTFDSSYDAGGESFAPADVSMSEFFFVFPSPRASGYVVQYDYANKKLVAYAEEAVAAGGPLVEASGNLSTLVVDVLVFGV